MAELCAERAERPAEGFAEGAWAHLGGRKAAAHEAHAAQTFEVTWAPAATPIADMVEATLPGGIAVEVVVLTVGTAELTRGTTNSVTKWSRVAVLTTMNDSGKPTASDKKVARDDG